MTESNAAYLELRYFHPNYILKHIVAIKGNKNKEVNAVIIILYIPQLDPVLKSDWRRSILKVLILHQCKHQDLY